MPDPYPDTIFTAVLQGLKPGEASVLPMPASAATDERRLLVRLVGHTAPKFQSFEDARGYVMRDVAQDQSEGLLQAEIARLRTAAKVTTDERALARLDLASFARMVSGSANAPPAPAVEQ